MATFDVRSTTEVSEIVFWSGGCNYAEKITPNWNDGAAIYDLSGDHVVIQDKQHALDMIKALEKAIELKWLK